MLCFVIYFKGHQQILSGQNQSPIRSQLAVFVVYPTAPPAEHVWTESSHVEHKVECHAPLILLGRKKALIV